MLLHWPEVLLSAFLLVKLGIAIAKHGEPGPPYSAVGTLTIVALYFFLLWKGGFFS